MACELQELTKIVNELHDVADTSSRLHILIDVMSLLIDTVNDQKFLINRMLEHSPDTRNSLTQQELDRLNIIAF